MAKISEVIAGIIGPEFDAINVQGLADNVGIRSSKIKYNLSTTINR